MSATKTHVTLKLTHKQLSALQGMIDQVNGDGDHENWTREAGGTPAEIRAIHQVEQLIRSACVAARQAREQTPRR